MPTVSEIRDYNGFLTKASRLGLKALVEEVSLTITGFQLLVAEEKQANGTKWIREQIDRGFAELKGWTKIASGGIDWTKTSKKGATVGVEVQVSGRSDMLAVDIMHLKEDLVSGKIDVGIIIDCPSFLRTGRQILQLRCGTSNTVQATYQSECLPLHTMASDLPSRK